jgi:hypothetical protein
MKAQRVVSHMGTRDKQKINKKNLILSETEKNKVNQLRSSFKNRLSFH